MISQRLQHKASQALIMSQQMQQSLKILQMTASELQTYIQSVTNENPFVDLPGIENVEEGPTLLSNHEMRYEAVGNHREGVGIDVAYKISLQEYLEHQINIVLYEPGDIIIATHMLSLLDENGYLREKVADIANVLKATPGHVMRVLTKLKELEPTGVFACNLQERISLQLKERCIDDVYVFKVLENLDMIPYTTNYDLAKKLQLSTAQVAHAIDLIKSTDPYPCSFFNSEQSTRIPDAEIYKAEDGTLKVKLNESSMPKVFLNSQYFDAVYSQAKNNTERKFCLDKMKSATWMQKCIYQRFETIHNVLTAIIDIQADFFNHGIDYLKPMTLSDVAKATGLHESTISRVSNNVLATPLGIHEIKYFFSNRINSSIFEDSVSSKTVKAKIKLLVDSEAETGIVLSDEQIVSSLLEIGIQISRRTVAKYRDALKILPSHIRKKMLR